MNFGVSIFLSKNSSTIFSPTSSASTVATLRLHLRLAESAAFNKLSCFSKRDPKSFRSLEKAEY